MIGWLSGYGALCSSINRVVRGRLSQCNVSKQVSSKAERRSLMNRSEPPKRTTGLDLRLRGTRCGGEQPKTRRPPSPALDLWGLGWCVCGVDATDRTIGIDPTALSNAGRCEVSIAPGAARPGGHTALVDLVWLLPPTHTRPLHSSLFQHYPTDPNPPKPTGPTLHQTINHARRPLHRRPARARRLQLRLRARRPPW